MKRKNSRMKKGWTVAIAKGILIVLGLFVLFGEFIAPYDHTRQSRSEPGAPPNRIEFADEAGQFSISPSIRSRRLVDPLERRYEDDPASFYRLGLFVKGDSYRLLGLIPAETKLFGVSDSSASAPRFNLLGTDALGRDRFSRLVIATRFSLLVCPLGALLAWLIGVAIGLVSGYAGRGVDRTLMGIADTMLALPMLVIVLAARAAFPLELPPMRAAVLLIVALAVTGWAEIARLTRGLVRSLKQSEYVLAARAIGLSEPRILLRHIFPNALPTLLTQALITLPYFLLAETALSFLGIGLQEPAPSLGSLLAEASDINQLRRSPLIVLAPGFAITAFVLSIRILANARRSEPASIVG